MTPANVCTMMLTEQQKFILEEQLRKENDKRKAKFIKKKLNHVNSPKLATVFDSLKVTFSDKLFDIPWRCSFGFYLYLILKSRVRFIDFCDMPEYYKIAIAQDFNILKLSKETGVCRNTIRTAYKELIQLNLIEETDYIKPLHKSTRSVLVYNDFYIYAFDSESKKVLYSTEVPHNFYNN
ncbi:MAG: hypothetical protein WC644_01265 [Ignavibacteria bacterium]